MLDVAYLNYLDLDRSFGIFMHLVNTDNIEILKNSINASQYYNAKFHYKMRPYFERIISNKELHDKGNLVVLSWLSSEISDKKLYNKFIKSSKEAKLCALKIAEENLFNKDATTSKKAFQILYRFLNEEDEEFASKYSAIILRKFKRYNFKKVLPFLLKYSKSKLCLAKPSYFLKLLLSCAKEYPFECLKLIENLDFSKNHITQHTYLQNEPVQLILAIYSKLNLNLKQNKKLVKRSLDVFDDMLKHNYLRGSASEAIEFTT